MYIILNIQAKIGLTDAPLVYILSGKPFIPG